MGRLYREHRNDGDNKKASTSSSSSSLSDALLFATICFVGLSVDVHVKDGSVVSGIFHTASLQHDYGIVLKNARMTKKGKANSNLANGALVETLVILSDDLVQLVAKGVLLPVDGDDGNLSGKDVEAVVDIGVPSEECTENAVEKPFNSAFDTKRTEQIRSSLPKENGLAQGFMPTNSGKNCEGRKPQVKKFWNDSVVGHSRIDDINLPMMKEASVAAVNGRQRGGDGLQGEKKDVEEKLEFSLEESTINVEGSNLSLDNCFTPIKPVKEGPTTVAAKLSSYEASCDPPLPAKMAKQSFEQPTSADASSCAVSSDVSTSSNPVVDVTSESCHRSGAVSTETVPHISQSNKSSKESRLNPGAKIFSPSFMNPISATSVAQTVETVAGIGYVPNNSPAIPVPAVQPEVQLNPGSHSSVPVKILPYANLPAGSVGSASQFSQPIIGRVGSRLPPLRYAVPYPIQAGPGIVHPNSESVTVGRLGQLVYVHPVSQELIPGVTALSSPFAPPLLVPHQVQFPKHQGGAASRAMQLCVAPPLVATGQQPPYVMPCHIPILQLPSPSNRYIQVPGSNVSLNAKFL